MDKSELELNSHEKRARLNVVLGKPELADLLARLRTRLQRGEPCIGVIRIQDPTPKERDALGSLLGRSPSKSGSFSIDLGKLETLLKNAGLASSLKEAIEILTGPVSDLKAEEAQLESVWNEIVEWISQNTKTHLNIQWIRLLKRLSKNDPTLGRTLVAKVDSVIQNFPSKVTYLAELAAQSLGDSHALDPGTPVSTLVLHFLRSDPSTPLDTAEDRRNLWASVGVISDDVSAPLLVLNLRAHPESLTGKALNLFAEQGEPYRLTLRQLLRHPPQFSQSLTGEKLFVCENPSVIGSIADRLGAHTPPMICLEGQPKTSAHILLREIRTAGIQIYYHGDFDWDGLRIANLIMRTYESKPWCFSSQEYLQSASRGSILMGKSVEALWDPTLAQNMLQQNKSVHEELVIADLCNSFV